MVRRLIEYLSREVLSLHNAAYLLALAALLSQILGLLRDRLFAASFGAGSALDVYYASFRIPDFIFVSVSSLVSVSVLIPFLVDRLDDPLKRDRFLSLVLFVFCLFITLAAGVAYIFTPYLSQKLFPGFDAELLEETIKLSRILLLSPFLLGLSNLVGSVLQAYRKFLLYAISPLLYNLGIIIGILWLYPLFGLTGLAYGVVLGAFLHLAIQLPILFKEKLAGFRLDGFDMPGVKELFLISLPRSLSLSLNQITFIVLTFFASIMGVGAIAIFNLSFNLQSVPLSIIAVSYSVAAFPVLSKLWGSGERKEFIHHVSVAARHIIFWSTPALILFIVLRAQIVRTVFGAGAFDWTDTRLTAAALAFFVISLIPQGLTLLFARGYYAAGDTKIPLLAAAAGAATTVFSAFFLYYLFYGNQLFAHFLESLLRVEGLSGSVVLILPLSYSIGMALNACILWLMFERRFGSITGELGRTFLHSFSGAVIGGGASYVALTFLGNYLDLDTFKGIFFQGFIALICGVLVLVGMLTLLRNEEFMEIKAAFGRRFRGKVIGPEATEI